MDTTTFDSQVTGIVRRNYNAMSIRLAVRPGLSFKVDQFMQVTLSVEGKEQSKYLSLSNSPTEKEHLEFTKKLTDSAFSKALENLKVGDALKVKMPMGSFVLDEAVPKHAFLAGGIGITPIRSIWKDAWDRGLPVDLALFYGNRTPQDVIFKDDLDAMAASGRNFKVVYSLDSLEACPLDWKGHCGFINAELIRQELPDFLERIFYVCGPPVMVKSLSGILVDALKIPEKQIKRENFAGY